MQYFEASIPFLKMPGKRTQMSNSTVTVVMANTTSSLEDFNNFNKAVGIGLHGHTFHSATREPTALLPDSKLWTFLTREFKYINMI